MGTKNFNLLDNIIAKLRLRRIVHYANRNDVILDFGCGYQAYLLNTVKNLVKEGIGIDYDVENRQNDNIKLIKFNYTNKLPFETECFDKVFMMAVLEHFYDDDADNLFKEIYRVLKIGGRLILTTPTPFGQKILEFLSFKLHLISQKEISDHKKYYSRVDITVIGEKNGFKLIEYKIFQFGINSTIVLEK